MTDEYPDSTPSIAPDPRMRLPDRIAAAQRRRTQQREYDNHMRAQLRPPAGECHLFPGRQSVVYARRTSRGSQGSQLYLRAADWAHDMPCLCALLLAAGVGWRGLYLRGVLAGVRYAAWACQGGVIRSYIG